MLSTFRFFCLWLELSSYWLRLVCVLGVLTFLAACTRETPSDYISQDFDIDEVTRVAKRALRDLQEPSFIENVEFCGFIGADPNGKVSALPHNRGRHDRCEMFFFPIDWKIIGTYHTHGGFDPQKKSEAPSVLDMKSVLPLGLIGFVSTPGGRFWMYGGETETANLICDVGCLPQDPAFEPLEDISQSYTLDQLAARERRR